jgi:hypothetical protein
MGSAAGAAVATPTGSSSVSRNTATSAMRRAPSGS